eukprot:4318124-Pyramimonas_sp.AAC.1
MPCTVLVVWLPNPTLIRCVWSSKAYKASGKLIARHCCTPPTSPLGCEWRSGKKKRARALHQPVPLLASWALTGHHQVLQPGS